MSLPPLPQFTNEYDGSKTRYMVQVLENAFNNITSIQRAINKIPQNQTFDTTTGNNSSTPTTLFSGFINGASVSGDGWQIKVKTFGTFASNANNKELKLYINNSVIFDSTALAVNGGSWDIEAIIVKDGINNQKNMVTTTCSNITFPNTAYYTNTSENFDAIINISLTGTGVSTNDIIGQVMILTLQPN